MRLWLSKNSEVPLREQLVTQIILGIVSDDLTPGERLPSTRELARRFHVHANTVSAAYRELARRGWVQNSKGSGVYVRTRAAEKTADPQFELDRLISTFFQGAREQGFSRSEIHARINNWFRLQPHDHFLVIEDDAELRDILVAEIAEATECRVAGASLGECVDVERRTGAVLLALHTRLERVQSLVPPETPCLALLARSVPDSLLEHRRPTANELVTVVSGWGGFLRWARMILVAVGLEPDALDLRSSHEAEAFKGLSADSFVITDALTARHLPRDCRPHVFRLIADTSLAEVVKFRNAAPGPPLEGVAV